MAVTIEAVVFQSPRYHEMVALRTAILRAPLGLSFTQEQLDAEHDYTHLAALLDGRVVGTLLLAPPEPDYTKLRQMAVSSEMQGMGVGAELMRFAEALLGERGVVRIVLHARDTAVGFYEKLGYTVFGEPFMEMTIPHVKMEKRPLG